MFKFISKTKIDVEATFAAAAPSRVRPSGRKTNREPMVRHARSAGAEALRKALGSIDVEIGAETKDDLAENKILERATNSAVT